LFGLAFGFVVLTRFRATNEQLRDLLATLAARVSEKEETLRTAYTKMEAMARHQERLAERGRILRNMHDGVGAHITSAMRQLLSGGGRDTPARTQVLMTLRDALDNLKLSIDSIHLAPGDITALLANLRYRLGPRFSAMGIELQWDVDLLPICEKLDASAMGELQFMLFEALSNVLQHAQAHTLRVEAHIRAHGESLDDASQKSEADQIYVRVVDDGVGFDPQARQSKGLANLRKCAVAIGAQLRISSTPGNTVVEIQLDV
jgi:signal transduction histidine kinase